MKKSHLIPFILSIFLATEAALAQPEKPVTAGHPSSVELTIYNTNFALIREERFMPLMKGFNTVVVPDIPATIDGTSLHFSSLTDPSSVRVVEQNFQYDLVHPARLLEKYIGREIEFVRFDEASKKEYTVRGKLLSTGWMQQGTSRQYYGGGQMVAEIGGKVEVDPAGRLVLPSLPEGLILKPQLEWMVSNQKSGEHKTEISYIAEQLTWNCDYVALLNAADNRIDLTGWVTLTNNSGTSFRNAGLKLVAGDVNVVPKEERYTKALEFRALADADIARPQFEQKELFEYKLYSLQRRTDVADNETKQIELTSGKNISAKKVFIYDGLADGWKTWMNNRSYREHGSFGQQSNTKVGTYVTFKNDASSGLGIPLPKGKVRVYKRDDDGKEQFVGEDRIDHTPKNEEIRLYLGNAFDLTGARVQKDFRSVVSGHVYEETFEITIRNHKSETVEVLVYEHPWRWNQWEIVKSNADYEKVDQTTVKFPVTLHKGQEKKLTYTIRYSW